MRKRCPITRTCPNDKLIDLTSSEPNKINLLGNISKALVVSSCHGPPIANPQNPKQGGGHGQRIVTPRIPQASQFGRTWIGSRPTRAFAQYRYLAPVSVFNPLAAYPNRDWERMYGISIGMTRHLCSSAVRTTRTTACSMRSSKTTWSFASSRDMKVLSSYVLKR